MSRRPEYMRLSRLINESLHPFSSDVAAVSLTDEIEKGLLIALSQVFRQVKQWTHELDSDEDLLAEDADDMGCSVATASLCSEECHCLANIITHLILLLAVKSQHVQHLAGNTLVAVAEFVVALDSGWDDFIHLLCLCLELAIGNSLTSSSGHGALENRCPDYVQSLSESLLKLKLENESWSVVASILLVLRNILKFLKRDCYDKIMNTYLESVSSLLSNLPWDRLSEIYAVRNVEALKDSSKDIPLHVSVVQHGERVFFIGNLIQFLCSLVGQSNFLEDGVGFSSVTDKIIKLVPKVVAWCHSDFQNPCNVRIIHYFRHKVLMLMMKLSSSILTEDTILMSWMHLIRNYFEDLLLQPMSEKKLDQDDFLEGSPFCTSISNPEKQNLSSRHLQRLTVFIFLKCSLNLVNMKGSSDEQQYAKKGTTIDMNLASECHSRSSGLTELHNWLQAHVRADITANHDLYFQSCVRFSSAFLQLFIHEDDILFEMLLQLLRLPFYPEHQIIEDKPVPGMKNHHIFLASDLFNPSHLFHLFLAEILYDHQVLLDYLISKDTGTSCAEYLLRSLRIVCNSWNLFVEFRGVEANPGQMCAKRRKVLSASPSKEVGISSVETEQNEGYAHGRKWDENYIEPFLAARDCLASLRTSINRLHKKNLFPYNPQVLLRRVNTDATAIEVLMFPSWSITMEQSGRSETMEGMICFEVSENI